MEVAALTSGAPYVLFLGRLNWKKGLDRLLGAAARIPNVTVVLAGIDEDGHRRVVEQLAPRLGAGRFARRYAGEFAEARGPRGPVALLVPTTYMNDSGSSVGPAAGTLHAAPGQVLVVHDDIDLPFGEVRGKRGGGPRAGFAAAT